MSPSQSFSSSLLLKGGLTSLSIVSISIAVFAPLPSLRLSPLNGSTISKLPQKRPTYSLLISGHFSRTNSSVFSIKSFHFIFFEGSLIKGLLKYLVLPFSVSSISKKPVITSAESTGLSLVKGNPALFASFFISASVNLTTSADIPNLSNDVSGNNCNISVP